MDDMEQEIVLRYSKRIGVRDQNRNEYIDIARKGSEMEKTPNSSHSFYHHSTLK